MRQMILAAALVANDGERHKLVRLWLRESLHDFYRRLHNAGNDCVELSKTGYPLKLDAFVS